MSSLRHLDLNLLKAFDVLMDERSVTRAADRLAVSQPAVSGMMNRLRENFNDPLFIRARRGIVPTPRAEALAGSVKRLLADAEAMLSPGEFDPATAEMILTVAGSIHHPRSDAGNLQGGLEIGNDRRIPRYRPRVRGVDRDRR